jgi:hypothetical protein
MSGYFVNNNYVVACWKSCSRACKCGGMVRSRRSIDHCARSKTRCGYICLEANGGATKMLAIMVGFFRHRVPPNHHGILASR